MANSWEYNIPADALLPDASDFPSRGMAQDRVYQEFDAGAATTQEAVSPQFQVPATHQPGDTLKIALHYTATASSGAVQWDISVEAMEEADNNNIETASFYDAANVDSEAVPSGSPGTLGVFVITLTNNAGIKAGDFARIKIALNNAGSTLTGQARLFLASLYAEQ